MFDATKVRKTPEIRVKSLHYFSHITCKRLHFPTLQQLRINRLLNHLHIYFLSLMMLTDSAPATSRIPATIIISL